MRSRLVMSSVLTLGVLLGFVFTVIFLIMYFARTINGVGLIALTIFFNIATWLLSPFFQDLVLKWFYNCQPMEWPAFQGAYPELAEFIERTCKRNKIPVPAIRIINDGNPTAYSFGSGSWNARLVATTGLFEYLNTEEVAAVYAHELGHIVNGDFAVMTFAATLLTVLYELYIVGRNTRARGRGDPRAFLPLIGYLSYVFYVIGTYIVLYLSRTREYLADRFSAEATRNPNALAMGLVKVAYGIVRAPENKQSNRLLASTRALGIYDYKAAHATGSAYALLANSGGGVAVAAPVTGSNAAVSRAPDHVERVFLYDLYNPWAKVGEFKSTHPLTGKRIHKLMEYCKEFGIGPVFDFSLADYEGQMIDRTRMYENFAKEVLIYFAPAVGFVLGVVAALVRGSGAEAIAAPLLGLGIGWSIQALYCFPSGQPARSNVFELMCDPYASPVRGRLVYLEGKIVGRAQAGSPVGEDMVFQDSTGLTKLNYRSWLPGLGDLWFGWKRVGKLMGEPVSAIGWFRRYTTSYIDLDRLNGLSGAIESYVRFWAVHKGPVVILIALIIIGILR